MADEEPIYVALWVDGWVFHGKLTQDEYARISLPQIAEMAEMIRRGLAPQVSSE